MDYTDKHESIGIDNSEGQFGNDDNLQIVTNAASVDISGIEFEVRAAPWDGGIVDQSNLSIADFSPEWTMNASIEHEFQLGNGATLTSLLGIYYQDDYDFRGNLDTSVNERSYCFQPGYSKFRARATYVPAAGDWQASLFGNNITDKRYFEWCGNGRGE